MLAVDIVVAAGMAGALVWFFTRLKTIESKRRGQDR
jgi:hypothetical protein